MEKKKKKEKRKKRTQKKMKKKYIYIYINNFLKELWKGSEKLLKRNGRKYKTAFFSPFGPVRRSNSHADFSAARPVFRLRFSIRQIRFDRVILRPIPRPFPCPCLRVSVSSRCGGCNAGATAAVTFDPFLARINFRLPGQGRAGWEGEGEVRSWGKLGRYWN